MMPSLSPTLEYDPWPSSLTMLVVLRDQAGFLGVRGDWARDWASWGIRSWKLEEDSWCSNPGENSVSRWFS